MNTQRSYGTSSRSHTPRPMVITAKYASACKVCKRQVLPGDRVEWLRGERDVTHVQCTSQGQTLALAVQESKASAPLASSTVEVPAPDGLEYLPYQLAGVQYAASREEGCLIADEMGCGKSIEALGYVNACPSIRSVLIVCPASLRINWEREAKKWLVNRTANRFELNMTTGVVEVVERADQVPTVEQFPNVGDVTIVNYNVLGKVVKAFPSRRWDLLILDEGHYAKNPKAARTKLVFELKARSKKVLVLTGTPVLNKPLELFPLLQLVAPEVWDPPGLAMRKSNGKKTYVPVGAGGGAGFFKYAKRYCNAHAEQIPSKRWVDANGDEQRTKTIWVFDGSSNLDELSEKLRSTCMVRRLKKDVLADLPAKRRTVVCFPKSREVEGLVDDESTTLGAVLKCNTLDEAVKALSKAKVGFADYSKSRHDLAMLKVEQVVEHVTGALEGGSEKVILFAHHHDVVAALLDALQSYGCVTVTGETGQADRQNAVDTFQRDAGCRVFIGSIGAAGVGITLTASSHVVFAELPLRPADLVQAEDRAHRIGQRGSVLVDILVFDGSVDAHIAQMLVDKQNVADLALDVETGLTFDPATRAELPSGALSYADVKAAARAKEYVDAGLTEEECTRLLRQMEWLASRCDGALAEDGAGFNKVDSGFGHALAECTTLSPKQALAARKLAVKYRRQLAARSW
jgi:SWI/SNF-related matrix-associated actin-dependent regulator 1 of chromatin subfamily A